MINLCGGVGLSLMQNNLMLWCKYVAKDEGMVTVLILMTQVRASACASPCEAVRA